MPTNGAFGGAALAFSTAAATSFFMRSIGLKFVLKETRSETGIGPLLPSNRLLCLGLRSATGGDLTTESRTGLEPLLGLELGINDREAGFGVKLALGFHFIEPLVGLCIALDAEAGPAGGIRGSWAAIW